MGSTMTATADRQDSPLVTDKGRTTIADSVVAKIAGTAAREVSGVHAMGGAAARALGTIKEKLSTSSTPDPSQGVHVDVGERETAVDLTLIVEYGATIAQLSESVRRNVIQRVEGMTGLSVTEVNISVEDVWLGDEEPAEQRVQ